MFRSKRFILLILVLLFISNNSVATIYWVGNSANCTGSTVHPSLHHAWIASRGSSSAADEIRLTDTINYVGSAHGDYATTNYNSITAGPLTIRGGFTDCFSTVTTNRRIFMGNTDTSIISVSTTTGFTGHTTITLRNLNLVNGAFRGISVHGNVDVFLENVRIADNQSGIFVTRGAGVLISADSIIENNDKRGLTGNGGGIECRGANSYVDLSGILKNNTAERGGNLHIQNGCYAVLNGGAQIRGTFGTKAFEGAGAYVGNGGELFSNGGASRVIFADNDAGRFGAGLYVLGTGKATLLNTYFVNNAIDGEGIIYAKDGGSSRQVLMDRAASCPFLISCSEIDNNHFTNSLVYADNSIVEINRTMVEGNAPAVINNTRLRPLFEAVNNAEIRLNRVAIFNHDTTRYLFLNNSTSQIIMSHITVANNTYQFEGTGPILDTWINITPRGLSIENSIFRDTRGFNDSFGSFSGSCNLVDNSSNWPIGTFHFGTPIFNNLAGGDPRQTSSSPGVDMCLQGSFAWSAERDIENQVAPVNDSTNQQGHPGHPDGMYDAGFDEVYTNIGNDEFLLMIQKQGSGLGTVLSTPVGIFCGSDCSEVYFNGTEVTLFADAITSTGSSFTGWSNCPLANGNECLTSVETNHTIIANFQTQEELIFANGFE